MTPQSETEMSRFVTFEERCHDCSAGLQPDIRAPDYTEVGLVVDVDVVLIEGIVEVDNNDVFPVSELVEDIVWGCHG